MITFDNTLQWINRNNGALVLQTLSDLTPSGSVKNLRTRFDIIINGTPITAVWRRAASDKRAALYSASVTPHNLLRHYCHTPNLGGVSAKLHPGGRVQVLTGWSAAVGAFTVLTTTGRTINDVQTGSVNSWVKTNDFSATAGDIVCLSFYGSNITTPLNARLYKGSTMLEEINGDDGLTLGLDDRVQFFAAPETGTDYHIRIGSPTQNYSGYITDALVTLLPAGDYPVVYFRVRATEYYDDATNVVQAGNTITTNVMLYVPTVSAAAPLRAALPGNFLSAAVAAAMAFYTGENHAWALLYISDTLSQTLAYKVNTGSEDVVSAPGGVGWGFVVVNDTAFAGLAPDDRLQLQLRDSAANNLTPWQDVWVRRACDAYSLQFYGRVGLEYIPLRGDYNEKTVVARSVYRDEQRRPLTYEARAVRELALRTLYEPANYIQLLTELLETTSAVYLAGAQFDNPTLAGVSEDEITSDDRVNLFTNDLKITYFK